MLYTSTTPYSFIAESIIAVTFGVSVCFLRNPEIHNNKTNGCESRKKYNNANLNARIKLLKNSLHENVLQN